MQARKDMDPRFQWDFTHMYASDEAWEAELNAVVKDLDRIAAVEGTLGASREAFKAGIDTIYEIGERLDMKPNTVVQRTKRALKKIREAWKGEES